MRELTTTDTNAVANRSTNRVLVDFVVLPFLFLTVALLGGLRIGAESRTFHFYCAAPGYALTRRSIDAAPRPRWSTQISSMG